jgi:hypothetical protein
MRQSADAVIPLFPATAAGGSLGLAMLDAAFGWQSFLPEVRQYVTRSRPSGLHADAD